MSMNQMATSKSELILSFQSKLSLFSSIKTRLNKSKQNTPQQTNTQFQNLQNLLLETEKSFILQIETLQETAI